MPEMYEIYDKHAVEYDELVDHEDYNGNLKKHLLSTVDFHDKTVFEFGAGTGRLTRVYAEKAKQSFIFDRSAHMLSQAKENLKDLSADIKYGIADNMNIESVDNSADIILEGWSFGHTIHDHADSLHETADNIITGCIKKLFPGGILIFIETLGTDSDKPEAPNSILADFYSYIEARYGFSKSVIRTDYKFNSFQDAERVTGYFFGEDFRKSLTFNNSGIIKEYTGVWSLKID